MAQIISPIAGKLVEINIKVGQALTADDEAFVVEAMKMENEIVSPQDGVVASINVTACQSVEAGALLATLN